MKAVDWKYGIDYFSSSTLLAKELHLTVSSTSVTSISTFEEWVLKLPVYGMSPCSNTLISSLMNYSSETSDSRHQTALTLVKILVLLANEERASLVFETQMTIVVVNSSKHKTRQIIIPKITRSLRTLLEINEFVTPADPDLQTRPIHEQIIVIADHSVSTCLDLIARVISQEASLDETENLQASVGLSTLKHITTNFPFPNLTMRIPQAIVHTNPDKTTCNVSWTNSTLFLPVQVEGIIRDLYEHQYSMQSLISLKLSWKLVQSLSKVYDDIMKKIFVHKKHSLAEYIFLEFADHLITQDNESQNSLLKRLTVSDQPAPSTPVIKLPVRRQAAKVSFTR